MMADSDNVGRWRALYTLGAVVGAVGVAALIFDIVLAILPGWGTDTVPVNAIGWLTQFTQQPWLAIRNLDALNATVSLVTLPMYLAIGIALRREQPGLALVGVVLVAVGTTLFASANAALPMLELAERYGAASVSERASIEAAAVTLLARGAHGSAGAFGGFIVSELGTLVVAWAMLRGRVFGRLTAWVGVVGAASLVAYSILMTFSHVPADTVVALAAPGGLLMIAWQVAVVRRLWALAGEDRRSTSTS